MIRALPFTSANILIPKCDHTRWATIACDQFTSQPEYWKETERIVGDAPSALHISLPEIYLTEDNSSRIARINQTMRTYLAQGLFDCYENAMVYVERTLSNGCIRRGIVGAIDLEAYDFHPGNHALIRATEGTVLDRIPPRVQIRRDAPLEMPHIMLLIDDPNHTVIEPLSGRNDQILYHFPLMQGGGKLRGMLLSNTAQEQVRFALGDLMGNDPVPMLFAVGDGNHSLATAKACYEENKTPENRYALVEIVNIHDEALIFEPIYRILSHVDVEDLSKTFKSAFGSGSRPITMLAQNETYTGYTDTLEVGALQSFLDTYLAAHPSVSIDYIHGEHVLRKLAEKPDTVGFLFDGMKKSELFPYIRQTGILPRKTFSMGDAESKRYYMECRKIND